jgi:hypothetical protein
LRKVITELLDDYPAMTDRWRGDRIRVRERAHDFADDRSTERFVAALIERLPA